MVVCYPSYQKMREAVGSRTWSWISQDLSVRTLASDDVYLSQTPS